jgi:hypothetical protein
MPGFLAITAAAEDGRAALMMRMVRVLLVVVRIVVSVVVRGGGIETAKLWLRWMAHRRFGMVVAAGYRHAGTAAAAARAAAAAKQAHHDDENLLGVVVRVPSIGPFVIVCSFRRYCRAAALVPFAIRITRRGAPIMRLRIYRFTGLGPIFLDPMGPKQRRRVQMGPAAPEAMAQDEADGGNPKRQKIGSNVDAYRKTAETPIQRTISLSCKSRSFWPMDTSAILPTRHLEIYSNNVQDENRCR